MKKRIVIVIAHKGGTSEVRWASFFGDLLGALNIDAGMHLVTLAEPPPLDWRAAGFTVGFRGDATVDGWKRESSSAVDMPTWMWRFKACYLVNPEKLVNSSEEARAQFARTLLDDLEQLFGKPSKKPQSAISIPAASAASVPLSAE